MILYSFRCPECSYYMDVEAPIGQAPQWVVCPICYFNMRPLSKMRRLFTRAIRSFLDIPPQFDQIAKKRRDERMNKIRRDLS